LDERNRPQKTPQLFAWATPDGWSRGLRPGSRDSSVVTDAPPKDSPSSHESSDQLVREIEQMKAKLGNYMYRGLLRQAKAWKPSQIRGLAEQRKTLDECSRQSGAGSG